MSAIEQVTVHSVHSNSAPIYLKKFDRMIKVIF